jgi:hypothetical protein
LGKVLRPTLRTRFIPVKRLGMTFVATIWTRVTVEALSGVILTGDYMVFIPRKVVPSVEGFGLPSIMSSLKMVSIDKQLGGVVLSHIADHLIKLQNLFRVIA